MPTIYVTAPPEDAASIARTLVEERLAACVNRFSCDSIYRWDGEIHEDEEVILLVKTTQENAEDVRERVETIHPYDVPCIEQFEESVVADAFAQWRTDSTDGSE